MMQSKQRQTLTKLPRVTPELLEYLEVIFPDVCPNKGSSIEDIYIKMGTVQVVRKLRSLYEEQKNNILG